MLSFELWGAGSAFLHFSFYLLATLILLVIFTPKRASWQNKVDCPVSALLNSRLFGRIGLVLAAHQQCVLCYKHNLVLPCTQTPLAMLKITTIFTPLRSCEPCFVRGVERETCQENQNWDGWWAACPSSLYPSTDWPQSVLRFFSWKNYW